MTDTVRPLTLVIAGLDSGGGAGISADMLTIHDMGAYGLPCVSALTSQSLKNVYSVVATDRALFEETLHVATHDFEKIYACKVGLVSHRDILESTLEFLEYYNRTHQDEPLKVVWDPVLNATAGNLESADLKGSLARILKVTTLFTPNLPEALALASWDEERLLKEGIRKLGEFFLLQGAHAVLIKGGHLKRGTQAKDTFISKDSFFELSQEKIIGDGAHGGGCALSSATAAALSLGYSLKEAVILAKTYVYVGIVNPAIPFNLYRPPLGHNGREFEPEDYPFLTVDGLNASQLVFKPLNMGADKPVFIDDKNEINTDNAKKILIFKNESLFLTCIKSTDDNLCSLVMTDNLRSLDCIQSKGIILKSSLVTKENLKCVSESGQYLGILAHGYYELLLAISLKPSFVVLDFRLLNLTYNIRVNPKFCAEPSENISLYTPYLKRDFKQMQALLAFDNLPFMVLLDKNSDKSLKDFLKGYCVVTV